MDEGELPLASERQRVLVCLVVVVPVQHRFAAQIDHGLHLDLRCRERHDDGRRDLALPRRQRDALRVVAGGGADHASTRDAFGQVRNLVVGAAQLERKDGLQILAFEEHRAAETPAQTRGGLEGRLDGDVVHARLEDALQVIVRHAERESVVVYAATVAGNDRRGLLAQPLVATVASGSEGVRQHAVECAAALWP